VQIQTNLSGLLGETVVNIIPQKELTAEAELINPLSQECQKFQLILCNKERIKGENAADLISSLTRLSQVYSSPEFYNNINSAVSNAALAGKKVAILSDELSTFSKDIKKDINRISKTADAFTNTANTTTQEISKLSSEFSATSQQINLLVTNLNSVINDNKANFSMAIANVSDTTEQLSNLVGELEFTVTEVNSKLKETEVKEIVKNLEEFSENLKQISESLNQPTNLVTLQQTLDSARVTFENTAKITSDLDELTGNPEFRNNVKKLVDGLSNLLSYNESLQKQIELAKILESANEIASNQTKQKTQIMPTPNLKKSAKKIKN
jgi:phospholipid/cholesterol/gamma-HCH transport system substrate-binding protein